MFDFRVSSISVSAQKCVLDLLKNVGVQDLLCFGTKMWVSRIYSKMRVSWIYSLDLGLMLYRLRLAHFDSCRNNLSKSVYTATPATVISIHSDHVQLSVERVAVCQRCQKGQGCGLGLKDAGDGRVSFARAELLLLNGQHEALPSSAADTLIPGSSVSLLLPQPHLMQFIIRALLLPAILVLFMGAIGQHIALFTEFSADAGALFGIIIGLFCGLILARKQSSKLDCTAASTRQAQLVLPAHSSGGGEIRDQNI